eukprot:8199584-Alexandrium_andersonii.AAC.1
MSALDPLPTPSIGRQRGSGGVRASRPRSGGRAWGHPPLGALARSSRCCPGPARPSPMARHHIGVGHGR